MKASDNVFPKLLLAEGAAPATPAAGSVIAYAKADGLLYSKDDAGTETPLGGGGGSGDVSGPASSVDSHVALFDGVTGKLLKDGGALGGMAGIADAPSDGTGYVRKDGAWAAESGAGAASWGTITGTLSSQADLQAALDAKADAAGVPIITEATTSRTIAPDDAGSYHRFTATGAKTATFDDGDGFTAGQEFHIANRAASDNLTLTAAGTMTLNPPKGGTLVLEPGDTVTVKMVATDEADVFGSTVAA